VVDNPTGYLARWDEEARTLGSITIRGAIETLFRREGDIVLRDGRTAGIILSPTIPEVRFYVGERGPRDLIFETADPAIIALASAVLDNPDAPPTVGVLLDKLEDVGAF
jgi:hypothetical protein